MSDDDKDGCSRCGACCSGLVLPFKPTDYLTARGGVPLNDLDGCGVWVPSVCPHLKPVDAESFKNLPEPGRGYYCDIYKTRPLLCRNDYLKTHGIASYRPKGCTRHEVG